MSTATAGSGAGPVTAGAHRASLRPLRSAPALAALVLLGAGLGFLAVRSPVAAVIVLAVPLAGWLALHPRVAAVAMAASIPFVDDISGGRLGINLALSDVLLVFLTGLLLLDALARRDGRPVRVLSPVAWPLAQYAAVMAVLLVAHLGASEVVKTLQRLDLFLFPLLVGAAMVRWDCVLPALRAYVLSSTVLALGWLTMSGNAAVALHLGQKNPSGQFMANAVLLLVAVPALRRRLLWALPVLVGGLLWTQSRGALVSVGVGLLVLVLVQAGEHRRRALVLLPPLAAATAAAFLLLPEEARERNLSFSSGTDTKAAWALHIREQYRQGAWDIIHAHPWTGIGVGQYRSGSEAGGDITTDPHQVLLQQAAEGGWILAASFVVLVAGCLLLALPLVRRTVTGPAAIALSAAIVGHAMADVYWVRGTPVLGWLLLGAALGEAALRRGRRARETGLIPLPRTAIRAGARA